MTEPLPEAVADSRHAKVFVSYRREDENSAYLAAFLLSRLEQAGHEVFVDTAGIYLGADWEALIFQRIAESDVFIVLLGTSVGESTFVPKEIRHANEVRQATGSRPVIVPIRVANDEPLPRDIHRIVRRFQQWTWKRTSDSQLLLHEIQRAIAASITARPAHAAAIVVEPTLPVDEKNPWLYRGAALGALFLAVLLSLFAYSWHQISLMRSEIPEREAAAANDALWRMHGLLIPRLWLNGSRDPEALAKSYLDRLATRLEEKSTPVIAKALGQRDPVTRNELDEALLASAEAAVARGSTAATQQARKAFAHEHYDMLVATLASAPSALRDGGALAVSMAHSEWRFVDDNQLWRCPAASWACSSPQPLTKGQLSFAAFEGDDEIVGIVADEQRLVRWKIERPQQDGLPDTAADDVLATAMAGEDGKTAIAYGRRSGGSTKWWVSVRIDEEPRQVAAGDGSAVLQVGFGPCVGCVSFLRGATVNVAGSNELTSALKNIPVAALGASSAANRLAIVDSGGILYVFDSHHPEVAIDWVNTGYAGDTVRSIAVSRDGTRIAVLHGGVVTIFGSQSRLDLIDEKSPGALAVTFAGPYTITRSTSSLRVWNVSQSLRDQADPVNLWTDWRQRLTTTFNGRRVAWGWDAAKHRMIAY